MKAPERLRDTASPEVRALLESASPSRAMTPEERSRSRARLGRYVAVAAVAGGLSWLPGAAFGAGLGLIVGIGTLVAPPWLSPDPPESSRPPAAATAPLPAGPASATPESPAAPPTAEARSSAAQAPSAPSASTTATLPTPEDLLAGEVALLDRARASLSGDPAEALRLAGEHAARYPRGKLGAEREMVAIDALRRLGSSGEARARAESLLAGAKGSLYEERIRKMIGTAE